MWKFLLKALLLIFWSLPVFGQEKLTLSQAIELALKNNYSIQISRTAARQAANDNTPGNAGFLPAVDATIGGSLSGNNTEQVYSSGMEVNKTNASSNNLNAGINLTWTLFDGMKMFATAGKLKNLAAQGELIVRLEIENTLYTLMGTYFDLIRLKQMIRSSEEALSVYEAREKIAQYRFNTGSGSRVEILQTKADKNSVRSILLETRKNLDNQKAALNHILARPPETDFEPEDSVTFSGNYNKDGVFTSAFTRNSMLLSAEKNIRTANYSIKEYQSRRFPQLGIHATYAFGRVENKAGFILLNQNLGYDLGFSLNWNLFNGFNTTRQIKNARLSYTVANEQYKYTKSMLGTELFAAWKEYEHALEVLKLEEENIQLTRENLDIALQRFELGASSILELKDAQNSHETASTRLVTARYQSRMTELMLMKLNGDLVK